MNLLLVAVLLQFLVALPDRTQIENPAVSRQVPKDLQKDYDKIWARFQSGKEDAKVSSDAGKLLKKNQGFVPALVIQGLIHHYAGRGFEAESVFEQVLEREPEDRFSLYYLAEAAFARREFLRAGTHYRRLLAIDGSRPDLEVKSQKALLLATEDLIAAGNQAVDAQRWEEAERLFRNALQLAPEQPSLHGQLAKALLRTEQWEAAVIEYRRQIELGDANPDAYNGISEALARLGRTDEARSVLERSPQSRGISDRDLAGTADLGDLGRWGPEIGRFREMTQAMAVTREQLASLIARYFPQIQELRKKPQIVTDIEHSWASAEIQTVLGVGILDPMPNHTFQPARTVTRGEFARALARLSRVLGLTPAPGTVQSPSVLASGDGLDADLRLVAGFGLFIPADSGTVDLSANLHGQEAVNAAEKLLRYVEKNAF